MTFSKVLRVSLFVVCSASVGCGVGTRAVTTPGAGAQMTGHVHGGQQPVSAAKVYLYAVSTTAIAGSATSILSGPGYVTTDAAGNFSIDSDYTCPTGAIVYFLAVGGNPGLGGGGENPDIALAAGIGPCSALTPSAYFTINEVTTVALANVVQGYATSATDIGGTSVGALAVNFAELLTFVDPTSGTALATNPGNGALANDKINSLANALAACVNSSGAGDPCASLLTDANVTADTKVTVETGGGAGQANTFQAAINIAQHPAVNVVSLFNLGVAGAPFQPTLQAAPSDWTLPVPSFIVPGNTSTAVPAFFNGQTDLPNGVEYLAFPNGNYFGYYSFLSGTNYLYHFDMGYEYFSDANDGQSGLYLYDFESGHTWYTSPTFPFPYIYDFNLQSVIYYYPDPTNPGHYNTNGVRYFYDFATGTIITM